jgi:hypothetical protein
MDGDLRFTSDYPHCAMNRMQYTYGGLAGVWDTSTETTGTHVLTVRAVDALGNASETHVTVQTAAMNSAAGSTGVQVPRMLRPAAQLQTHRSFLAAWGPEVIGTVGDYDVDVTEAPPGKGFNPSRRWLTATTDRIRVFRKAQPGATYCLSARTRTPLGAVSPWSPQLCTSIPFDDRGLSARRGNWSRVSGRRLYLGTSTVSDQRGAELTLRGVLATHLLLIGTRCRSCGTVEVYWKGNPIRRVSLAAHRTRRRSRFDLVDFSRVERGTVTIKVLTSGRPVNIDGLGASRS